MKMKQRILSLLLCACMISSLMPVSAFAIGSVSDNNAVIDESGLCEHHTEHDADCGYTEGSEGSPCAHNHEEACYKLIRCVKDHTDPADCTVESGCVTMSLVCQHAHDTACGYSEGSTEVPCGHQHDESCGYVEAMAGNPCANAESDPACNHSGDCGYVAPVEGVACNHTEHTDCGYAEAVEGTLCTHTHSLVVGGGCYAPLCAHAQGQHDDTCGFAAAVEASACTFHCDICHEHENEAAQAPAPTEAPVEEPVCTCEEFCDGMNFECAVCAEDFGLCTYYVPTCYCVEKCTEDKINEFCDVCLLDHTACGGTDTAAAYGFTSLTVGGVNALEQSSGTGWSYANDTLTITGGEIGAISATPANNRDVLNITVTGDATVDGGIYAGGKLDLVVNPNVTLTVNYSGNDTAIRSGYAGVDDSLTITGGGTVVAISNGNGDGIKSGGGLAIENVTVATQGKNYGLHSGDGGYLYIRNNSKVYAVAEQYGIYVGKNNNARASIIGANTVVVAGFALGDAPQNYAPTISTPSGGGISTNYLTVNCGHLIVSSGSNFGGFDKGNTVKIDRTDYTEYISHLTYQPSSSGKHKQVCAGGCPVSYAGTEEACSGTTYCTKIVCNICGQESAGGDNQTHKGGKATCTAKAVCELCQKEYGEKDPTNHTGEVSGDYTFVDIDYHSAKFSCCESVGDAKEAHTPAEDNDLCCGVCGSMIIGRALEMIKNANSGDSLDFEGVLGTDKYPVTETIAMDIPEGVTVNWNVKTTGDKNFAFLTLSGKGTLNLLNTIENTNTSIGRVITLKDEVTLVVSEGGEVKTSNYPAIDAEGGKEIWVNGGTVSGSYGIRLGTSATTAVTVTGGTVTGTNGSAIHTILNSGYTGTIIISDSVVTGTARGIDTKGKVVVSGDGTVITDTGTNTSIAAIRAGAVEIYDSPTIESTNSHGILADVTFKANSGAKVTGGNNGISGLITVEQGAKATVIGTSNGVYYTGSEEITVDGELTVNSTSSTAVYAPNATINVNGKLTAETTSTSGDGIKCASLTVSGTVDATGGTTSGNGIYATTALTINGGSVKATSTSGIAVAAGDAEIMVTDGVLRATTGSGTYGVTYGTMTVSGNSHVVATGNMYGIAAPLTSKLISAEGDYYWYKGTEKPADLHSYTHADTTTHYGSGSSYYELVTKAHLETGTLYVMDAITCACGDAFSIGSCTGGETTCAKGAVCTICGIAYTNPDSTKHIWGYSAEGSVITATCNAGCGEKATLTLKAPTLTTYRGTGNASATTTVDPAGALTSLPSITYSGRNGTIYASSTTAPTDAGSYTASITVGDAEAKVNYTIKAQTLTITAKDHTITYGDDPANNGVSGLDDSIKDMLSGTLDYEYSYKKGDDVGTYTITPTGLTSNNRNFEINFVSGTLTVEQATPSYTVPTGLTATYGQPLADVKLLTENNGTWSWESTADAVGNVGTQTHEATFTPSDTKNYKTITDVKVSVVVGKADPTYTVPTGLTATYGDELNSVVLNTATGDTPGNWSWKDATGSFVGNVGSNSFTAVFNPTDNTNYKAVETTLTIAVEAKKVTVTGLTAADRDFNGEKTVSLSGGTISSIIESDNLTIDLSGAVGTMEDANAGNGKAVTVTGIKLGGTSAANYELTAQPSDVTVNISQITATESVTLPILYNDTTAHTVDLLALLKTLPGWVEGNTLTYSTPVVENSNSKIASAERNGDNLTVTLAANLVPADKGTVDVTVEVTNLTNYSKVTITVTVDITDKKIVTVNASGVSVTGKTYDSQPVSVTGTPAGSYDDNGTSASYIGTFEAVYTGTLANGTTTYGPSTTAPSDTGTYQVYFRVPESNASYTGDSSEHPISFTISKRQLTWDASGVTVTDQEYVPNKTTVDTVSGNPALGNVVTGDDVTFTQTGIAYAFADDKVGTDKPVTATVNGLALSGADAANYILPANTFTVKGNITEPNTGDDGVQVLEGSFIITQDTELPGDAGYYGTNAGPALDQKFGTNGAATIAAIKVHMQEAGADAISKLSGVNTGTAETSVLEVSLMYYDPVDQTWEKIDEGHLDEVQRLYPNGVPVTIPYSLFGFTDTANYSSYQFIVQHMITLPTDSQYNVGDIEDLSGAVTATADGLTFKVTHGFSPFVVGFAKSAAPPVNSITGVTVTPASAALNKGATQQFNATVNGTGSYSTAVIWSISGHTSNKTSINASGLLTIGSDETAASITVKVTAVGDATKYATATVTVNNSGGTVDPGHTHSFGSWQYDSKHHWRSCSCGTYDSHGEHSFGEWKVTKAATTYTNGSKERSCTVCGYTETAKIPATIIPQTGDNSHTWLWIALMTISLAGAAGVLIMWKRNRRKKSN